MLSTRGQPIRVVLSALLSVSLTACGGVAAVKQTVLGSPKLGVPAEDGFIGAVAVDEPQAAQIGKRILAAGGSAADAAAAIGFALAVTLPSRAGLGGGGACLAFSPRPGSIGGGAPEAIVFTSRPSAPGGGDRPAAAPMVPRGLFALQARYGVLPIEQIVAPAEQLANVGAPVSRALASDLAVVGGALLADAPAAAVFGRGGAVLAEGDTLVQIDLGATLASLRVRGVADFYEGTAATNLLAAMPASGGGIGATDLRNTRPALGSPIVVTAGRDSVAFLPPPADGGLAAAAAFRALLMARADTDTAQARALAAAATWRTGNADAAQILHSPAGDTSAATLGSLPASTAFVTLDRTGGAVGCAITMGNLFGTGRVARGTGVLLAASPAATPPPLLSAALAWTSTGHAFRAAVAGSGQAGAALGVASGMANTLVSKTAMPATVPSPGRINAIACPHYLPGDADLCTWATDPRGDGLALGSN